MHKPDHARVTALTHPQGNEAVIDTYRWCMRCCTVLQDPRTLYWDEPLGMGDLRVVAASYGHKKDPRLAFDVRRLLQARVVRHAGRARGIQFGSRSFITKCVRLAWQHTPSRRCCCRLHIKNPFRYLRSTLEWVLRRTPAMVTGQQPKIR